MVTPNHLRSFYTGKRVLITGHSGFKGSWLSAWLCDLGATAAGYALASAPGGLYESAGLAKRMACYDADVRNPGTLRAVCREFAPDIVFHLAAQPLVLTSYERPAFTFETNVMGTVNLLDAVRQTPSVKAVVIVTTDKVYKNRESERGYREDDELGGHDPYAASKAAAEIVVASYRDSFFEKERRPLVATARAGNVIGGGDWAENRILPDCIRSLKEGKTIRVRSPLAVRPWQHVLEPLAGYLMLAQRLYEGDVAAAGPFNFGPRITNQVPVADLVTRVVACWGGGDVQFDKQEGAPVETGVLHLDIAKTEAVIGWVPALSFDETVAMTVREYRAIVADAKNATVMMAESIAAFEKHGV
jgi:CDP-glucose 4,6-dehydratase